MPTLRPRSAQVPLRPSSLSPLFSRPSCNRRRRHHVSLAAAWPAHPLYPHVSSLSPRRVQVGLCMAGPRLPSSSSTTVACSTLQGALLRLLIRPETLRVRARQAPHVFASAAAPSPTPPYLFFISIITTRMQLYCLLPISFFFSQPNTQNFQTILNNNKHSHAKHNYPTTMKPNSLP